MKNIKILKKEFENGKIEKNDYIKKMYESHQILEKYQELLGQSSIKSITIREDGLIFNFNGNNNIKMYHFKDEIYDIPLHYINFGEYEEELQLIYDFIEEGNTILDIGANVGWYSLNFIKKFENVEVHSFEPIPKIFDNLLENFKLNNVDSSQAYNIGLYKDNTTLDFFHDVNNNMASSITNLRNKPENKKVKCKVKKLDDFLEEKNINQVDLIKCDVEGAEYFVYLGAVNTIKKHHPIIFSEMLRKWSAKFNYHPNDIISFLSELGYRCYALSKENVQIINEVDENTIATNFLFLHPKKHKKLVKKLFYRN
jgi:FkbM family methyltransferase